MNQETTKSPWKILFGWATIRRSELEEKCACGVLTFNEQEELEELKRCLDEIRSSKPQKTQQSPSPKDVRPEPKTQKPVVQSSPKKKNKKHRQPYRRDLDPTHKQSAARVFMIRTSSGALFRTPFMSEPTADQAKSVISRSLMMSPHYADCGSYDILDPDGKFRFRLSASEIREK